MSGSTPLAFCANNTNILECSGGALGANQQTASAFGIAIGTGLGVFLVQATLFQLFKGSKKLRRIYQPRTYMVPEKQKTEPPPNNPFKWFMTVVFWSHREIIHKCGLDAYVFLRYLRMLLKIFVPLALLIPLILLPINKVGGKDTNAVSNDPGNRYNNTGLNQLSIGNVSDQHPERLWAHCILALVVVGLCCYVFFDELVHFIQMRLEHLSSAEHRLKASATTVLIQNIPPELQTEKALMDLFDVYPGGIRKIWVNKNYNDLAKKVGRRTALMNQLEAGELSLIRKANKKALKQEKKGGRSSKRTPTNDVKENLEAPHTESKPARSSETLDVPTQGDAVLGADFERSVKERLPALKTPGDEKAGERADYLDGEAPQEGRAAQREQQPLGDSKPMRSDTGLSRKSSAKPVWQQYLKQGDRDKMRIWRYGWTFWTTVPAWPLIFLPLTKTVDKIYYPREHIAKLNAEIEADQADDAKFANLNSAFIQFHNQAAAHMCVQTTTHHLPLHMTPRYVEISPHDVLWFNLSLPWWNTWIRQVLFLGVFVAIIFLWAVPFSIIGFMSNLSAVGSSVSWLSWISRVDKGAVSVFQGLVPPLLTQLLLEMGLPMLMRIMIWLTGVPAKSVAERMLQHYFYAFLFIEVVLVSTISSGLTATIQSLVGSPYDVLTILATNLPKASNYFLSYVILQALSFSAGQLLQTGRLFIVGCIHLFLNPSPRNLFGRYTFLNENGWGRIFPFFTNFATIALIYSVISPIILFEVLFTFGLFWVVYRNNNLFVVRNNLDFTGLHFPIAVFQLFTGIYVLELALIGYFFIIKDINTGDLACIPQAIVMIVALLLTIIYHVVLFTVLSPLLRHVPITLEDDAVIRDQNFRKALRQHHGLDTDETDTDGGATDSAGKPSVEENRSPLTATSPSYPGLDTEAGAVNGTLTPEASAASPARRASPVGKNSLEAPNIEMQDFASNSDVPSSNPVLHQEQDHSQDAEPSAAKQKQPWYIRDLGLSLPTMRKQPRTKTTQEAQEKVMAHLRRRQARRAPKADPAAAVGDLDPENAGHKAKLEDNDAIAGIMAMYNDELAYLSPNDRDALVDVAYTNPALRTLIPVAWLPQDVLGIGDDEVARMTEESEGLCKGSTEGARLRDRKKGKCAVSGPPPDYSEFWLIEPEL